MSLAQNPSLHIQETSIEDLRKLAASGHLYAIVDSCRIPTTPRKALELGDQWAISLYRETPEEAFWDVAPYLLNVGASTLDWLLGNVSTEGWGIFVASKGNLGTLRRHFRHFLKAQSPAEEIWLFRFYDPRVLPFFFNGCTNEELRTFFGPVLAFGISNDMQAISFYQQKRQSEAAIQSNYTFMFRLREEHLTAMEPAIEADFRRRLKFHLRDEHGSVVDDLDDKTLEDRISLGLDRARAYGIGSEVNLVTFVALMFEIAPEFDMQRVINQILRSEEEDDGDVRMNSLFRVLSKKDWEEAEHLNRPGAWEDLRERSRR